MTRPRLRVTEPGERSAPSRREELRGAELDRALADALDRLACRPDAKPEAGLVPTSLRRFLD
jgi:hypothetical protein